MKFNSICKCMILFLTMAAALVSYAGSTFNMTIDLNKINNKSLSGKNFYFTFKGSKLDDSTHQYFLAFNADGTFKQFVVARAGTNSADYSYTQKGPVITFKNIPNFSGRMYISLNYPMYLTITKDANGNLTIADPSPGAQNDTNYLTIYDKVEFTLDAKNVIWADTTAVDFVSIPSVIAIGKGPSIGIPVSRSKLFQGCITAFSTGILPDGSKVVPSNIAPDWSSCVLSTAVNSQTAYLRVVAPNQSPAFNTSYLNDYINAIWAYYQKKGMKLSINCTELAGDTSATPATRASVTANPIFVGSVTSGNYWSFTNDNGKIAPDLVTTVNMVDSNNNGVPASNDVFGAANEGPFAGDNHTIKSVITKYFLSAIVTGMLPITGNPTLNTAYYVANKKSMFITSSLVTPSGSACPWYDLYSAALHKFGGKIYAFAYDDAMGMDSTVNTNAPATVVCTINDLSGIVIPVNNHNAKSYTTLFGVPSIDTLQVQYKGAYCNWETGKGLDYNGQTIANPVLPSKVNIKYGNTESGSMKVYSLDLNYPSNSTLPGCDIHMQSNGIMYIGLPAI